MQIQPKVCPQDVLSKAILKCSTVSCTPIGARRKHTQRLARVCRSNTEDTPQGILQESKGNSNGLLAGGAVAVGAAAFVAIRLLSGAPTFENLERVSTPLDTALQNGKPTVIEFYASWCNICRELLPDTLEVQRQYNRDVNFVALNIENSRWAPEIADYRVRGIPYYAFLDSSGHQQAAAVGRLPREDGALALLTRSFPCIDP